MTLEPKASVRVALSRDAEAIAQVHVQCWRTTYKAIIPDVYLVALDEQKWASQWKEWLDRDIRIYFVELGNEVVGFVSGGALREQERGDDGELYTIYLLDRAQGLGLGKVLVKTLSSALASDGFKTMLVWVLKQNPAIRFYEYLGAIQVSGKEIEIGGPNLQEISFGRTALKSLTFFAWAGFLG